MRRSGGGGKMETAILAAGLTVFAACGFIGLTLHNASLAAAGRHFYAPEIWVDRLIPLRTGWVWVYLSYYVLCFLPLFLWRRRGVLRSVAIGLGFEFAVAFAFFLVVPIRMLRPEIPGGSIAAQVLRWVYSVDPGFNIFPSLHVANAVLVALLFQHLRVRRWAPLVILWAAAVSLSTLLVKQHYFVDVLAGVALAYGARWAALRGLAPTDPGPAEPLPATAPI